MLVILVAMPVIFDQYDGREDNCEAGYDDGSM